MRDPTERFSSRVENYIKYRPGYPSAVLGLLQRACGLTAAAVVADIGAGTGLLAELFLANGNRVFGVEPNREMREASARLLAGYPGYTPLAGRAEATTLPAGSVEFVTAGQAFHWFDPEGARAEFRRILRPGGWAVLVWNVRRTESTPFLASYEALLHTYAPDYSNVPEHGDKSAIRQLFGDEPVQEVHFENAQHFDLAGLEGRLLSSSYAPPPDDPNYAPMMQALARLFADHAAAGQVAVEYQTEVYYGQLEK
ncbi:MAG: class I SAM-dependent methyltransferase [Chloroflexia bacterium]